MSLRAAALAGLAFLAACGQASDPEQLTATGTPDPIVSGSTFLTPETQALQADDFANPGFLWVDRGRDLFQAAQATIPSCASCHGDDGEGLMGVAATYPAWDAQSGRVLNLEGRINTCRERHQSQAPLDYESEDLLALTAYVAHLSNGLAVSVTLTPELQPAHDAGEAYFFTRRGQFNLSCAQCHNDNWGKQLRGDRISQGHGNGFPAYRLEWQSLGSLHRRLQDCDTGVRAEPMALGSDTYTALEVYLAVRASGLDVEAPGVRR